MFGRAKGSVRRSSEDDQFLVLDRSVIFFQANKSERRVPSRFESVGPA